MCLLKQGLRRFANAAVLGGACILVACSLTESVPPTNAEIESVGILAIQGGKHSAVVQLTRWADAGLPVAQRELGLNFIQRAETWPQAVQLLTKSALAGDAEAQFVLANAFLAGQYGLAVDHLSAWTWLERAARQGDGKASFMLARMASHGQGVTADEVVSVQWLQEASKQKNAQAMYQLSVAYATGNGIHRNAMQARYWLNLSAEYDYSIAVQALALELDGLGGSQSPFAERSRNLLKEAKDHRLMRWNTHQ
jgi:hypothetical protein